MLNILLTRCLAFKKRNEDHLWVYPEPQSELLAGYKMGRGLFTIIIRGEPERAPNTRETGSGVYIFLFVRDLA